MNGARQVSRAVLSVADKTGIVAFARALARSGVEILSTGGTRSALAEAGVDAAEVAAETGFPEIMDGRVKSLHPRIHGGILGRGERDRAVMAEHGIRRIDLVVVNLYPFAAAVERPDCTFEQAVANIDIGGPAMLRSAAKNHREVLVVVDPGDYEPVAEQLATGGTAFAYRLRMAVKAFAHTAAYDAAIARYLGRMAERNQDNP